MKNIKNHLLDRGINPSFHRLKIYEYLISNPIHPTAEKIYSEIIKEIPTLSKTTIYNTLKSFLEKGLVTSLTIEGNEARYDANTDFHGHFKCIRCDALYDIQLNIDDINIKNIATEHKILENHLYFIGICKKCLNI